MAVDLKEKGEGAGPVDPAKIAVEAERPTAGVGPDPTLVYTSPAALAEAGSAPGVEATISLPGLALSHDSRDTDDIDRTSSLIPSSPSAAAAASAAPRTSAAGRQIGPYTVIRELGRGGMGVVHLARHEQLGRIVALKMILAGGQAGADAQQRFLIEAKSIARLSHAGIVTVYDIGEHEGLPYFSLEYVPGASLSDMVADHLLEPKQAATIVAKMAAAMQYAHDKGVLHRDLKPSNVLMADETTPKITDFGLAKQIEDAQEAGLTQSGAIMGTPSYMSPEQASGDATRLGPPTDQYSLGAVLYQLLAGRAPFVAPKTFLVIKQVLADEPVSPRKLAPQVPADLETICLKALQKDATKRYASCQEFADDLNRFLEGRPIVARPVPRVERLVRWCRRNPVVAATSATAIAALVAFLAVVSWSSVSLSRKNTAIVAANTTIKKTNVKLEERRQQAEAARRKAEVARKQEEAAKKEAEAATQTAYERTKLATESFRLVVDKTRDALLVYPQFRGLRKELILSALDGLEKLPADPADRILNGGFLRIQSLEYLYETYLSLGEPSRAAPLIEEALALARKRNAAQGGTDATRNAVASVLFAKARARQLFQRDIELSLACTTESVALLESILAAPNPAVFDAGNGSMDLLAIRQLLLRVRNVHTAMLWQQGRIGEMLAHARRNGEILEETIHAIFKDLPPDELRVKRSGTAQIHQYRAIAALRAGEADEARQQQLEALDLARLWTANGGGWMAHVVLADVLGFTGDFYVSTKDDAKAREAYEEAVKVARELYAQDSTSEEARNLLNVQLIKLAGFERLRDTGKHAPLYEEAVTVAREKVAADPSSQAHKIALALSLAPAGHHEEASEIAKKLLETTSDAELFIDMARVYSQSSATVGLSEAKSNDYRSGALACLKQAAEMGYRDSYFLTFHPDFAPLQAAPEFADLLKRLPKNQPPVPLPAKERKPADELETL